MATGSKDNNVDNFFQKAKKILSNWIVKNLLLAVAALLVIVFIASLLLGGITKHGKEMVVPDFTGMTVEDAVRSADDAGLRIEIGDSVYIRRFGRGLVYSQNPNAGGKVKKGRRVYLTINAVNPKKVGMPNLVGFSLRQAKAELQSRGLTLGRLIYVKDIATNNVLEQKYRGRRIEPGTMIETLSRIDLELGLNPDDNTTRIPSVMGLKYLRAVDVIHDYSLNVRRTVFDKNIKTYADSLDAVVYKQNPSAGDVPILIGEDVTLYFRLEKSE